MRVRLTHELRYSCIVSEYYLEANEAQNSNEQNWRAYRPFLGVVGFFGELDLVESWDLASGATILMAALRGGVEKNEAIASEHS